MLTINLSYAGNVIKPCRPSELLLEAPDSAHDAMRYAASLAGLSGHELMDRQMTALSAWILSMDRRFDRARKETEALEKALDLIKAERARRDPKYGLLLKEKRA
jgi:hypothetical protein